ncbi:dTDP-4-dehydrorhamnose 3,5-epimerase [Pontibacter silvestris]|uniref:dTDP-4-dehydrorhamnose 3,5-epimerase n=1 Tax=Pontibacter silvestris TaxID=2305183 RepID=A0ABW4X4N2_9BACT|nr:dTDP-4-dehydrorhamnose 3,5-epimerase [Pontibacter silvestris]MCC9135034.1 dTDP-4-dehydrorhamnose 3,5-epimerase [Pontibacter silvestris]
MIFTETKLKGAYIIELKKIEDERGFFARAWCQNEMTEHGLADRVLQTNVSFNPKKGTLRGMHYQVKPHEESKLVRCTRGAIFDVIIDLRVSSDSYKQWLGVKLTADNYRMLYVPEGFAHGYLTLEDNTEVTYQVSEFYTPGAEQGIRWNDPAFRIEWPLEPQLVSEKDKAHADFAGQLYESRE